MLRSEREGGGGFLFCFPFSKYGIVPAVFPPAFLSKFSF